MAMVTQSLSIERSNSNLRDASFSSYLNSAEDSSVQKLAESSRNIRPGEDDEDGEIDVFGAEKYFNGVIDEENAPRIATLKTARNNQFKQDVDVDIDLVVRPKMQQQQPGTPSVRSESSWNSQSMLLNSIRRNSSQTKGKKVTGKSFLGGLGCKCSCTDKNSVDIHEQDGGEVSFSSRTSQSLQGKSSNIKAAGPNPDTFQVKKTHSDSWIRDKNVLKNNIDKRAAVSKNGKNHVSFPALKSHESEKNFHVQVQFEQQNQEMKPRKSVEVFGSPVYERRSKSFALDNKGNNTTMLSFANPKIDLSGAVYSDCESDASSDLFEIESITGGGKVAGSAAAAADPCLRRQVSDVTVSECVTPTTCYAPSEASIEWSVVTASAADHFSTVTASDYEDQTTITTISPGNNKKTLLRVPYAKMVENKDVQRKGGPSTLLLGCNNQKAVRIAGAYEYARKSFDLRILSRKSTDSFMPSVARYHEAECSNKRHFDYSRQYGQFASISPSINVPASRSSHGSKLLYID